MVGGHHRVPADPQANPEDPVSGQWIPRFHPAAVDLVHKGVGDLEIDRLPALRVEKEVGRLGAQVGLREGVPQSRRSTRSKEENWNLDPWVEPQKT